ncbi:hypothetical protein C7H19_05370 [Aphanothece hegewaldii CCALA 016]|uniref:Uncharacterized protein n=1 Tax=Aphanothece hegewaldii CCALA 016 TaxID=2107694 RepID=A0A2T1M161_9CHRO|nr:DUF6464 family protein [Aphanothece hegewaldii]PSF38416.1 hypothetical protein C7H19_05370 [Aphanothece hegewaldii CCALA 016]
MIRIIIIFVLALIPSLLGLEIIRQYKRRFQARMRRIRTEPVYQIAIVSDFLEIPQESRFFIGEINCRYNARSPHLRCAINPSGPCEGCLHYEAR